MCSISVVTSSWRLLTILLILVLRLLASIKLYWVTVRVITQYTCTPMSSFMYSKYMLLVSMGIPALVLDTCRTSGYVTLLVRPTMCPCIRNCKGTFNTWLPIWMLSLFLVMYRMQIYLKNDNNAFRELESSKVYKLFGFRGLHKKPESLLADDAHGQIVGMKQMRGLLEKRVCSRRLFKESGDLSINPDMSVGNEYRYACACYTVSHYSISCSILARSWLLDCMVIPLPAQNKRYRIDVRTRECEVGEIGHEFHAHDVPVGARFRGLYYLGSSAVEEVRKMYFYSLASKLLCYGASIICSMACSSCMLHCHFRFTIIITSWCTCSWRSWRIMTSYCALQICGRVVQLLIVTLGSYPW